LPEQRALACLLACNGCEEQLDLLLFVAAIHTRAHTHTHTHTHAHTHIHTHTHASLHTAFHCKLNVKAMSSFVQTKHLFANKAPLCKLSSARTPYAFCKEECSAHTCTHLYRHVFSHTHTYAHTYAHTHTYRSGANPRPASLLQKSSSSASLGAPPSLGEQHPCIHTHTYSYALR